MKIPAALRSIWSASRYVSTDISAYAAGAIEAEARRGVMLLGALTMALLLGAAALHARLGLGSSTVYTFLALAALSLHILVSTRVASGVRAIFLLAMVLLVVSGTALVLLAHRNGSFGSLLLSAVALLFMTVPIVPWGLREALTVTSLIYFVFTASTLSVPLRFAAEDRWALQFLMLGAGSISLTLVVRSVLARKKEVHARFDLERSHRQVELLALQDPLTGCWNRRYLTGNFTQRVAALQGSGDCLLVLLDIDRFKPINDTYGHAHGDRLLQSVAQAYGALLHADEMLVRLGGDEFALLLRASDAPARLAQASLALQAHGRMPDIAPAAHPTLSAGSIRLAPPRGGALPVSLDSAYAGADQALYAAKRAGGNRLVDASHLQAPSEAAAAAASRAAPARALQS